MRKNIYINGTKYTVTNDSYKVGDTIIDKHNQLLEITEIDPVGVRTICDFSPTFEEIKGKVIEKQTAKERALELGERFYEGSPFEHGKQRHLQEIKLAKERAKKCSEEILSEITDVEQSKFYDKVIEEIEKL